MTSQSGPVSSDEVLCTKPPGGSGWSPSGTLFPLPTDKEDMQGYGNRTQLAVDVQRPFWIWAI